MRFFGSTSGVATTATLATMAAAAAFLPRGDSFATDEVRCHRSQLFGAALRRRTTVIEKEDVDFDGCVEYRYKSPIMRALGEGLDGPEPSRQNPKLQPQKQRRYGDCRFSDTVTAPEVIGLDVSPDKPKIVVLGASSKVGRHVIRQLLEQDADMTIVALVKDSSEVGIFAEDQANAKVLANRGGPKLEVKEASLVPPYELPGFVDTEDEDEEEEDLDEFSPLAFNNFIKNMSAFNKPEESDEISPDEVLEDAIADCTTIISCVDSIRRTNIWTDFLQRPFTRILNYNVSGWCKDSTHPYYSILRSTYKAIGYAQNAQRKREEAARTMAEQEGLIRKSMRKDRQDDEDYDYLEENEAMTREILRNVPRIRFVRISDSTVSQAPFCLWPMVNNMARSMVYRYHEMADNLLEESDLIDCVVLRPGDVVKKTRDKATTSVEVSHEGDNPFPGRVGREDVATLAVASALFPSNRKSDEDKPFHYSFGLRWGTKPPHRSRLTGNKMDGKCGVSDSMRKALQKIKREKKERSSTTDTKPQEFPTSLLSEFEKGVDKRKTKPYGICVAVPVYLFFAILTRATIMRLWPVVASRTVTIYAQALLGAFAAFVMQRVLPPLASVAQRVLPTLTRPKLPPF